MTMANPIELELEVPKVPTIEIEVREKSVIVHKDLLGRDENDQHPIGAITGLQSALNARQLTSNLVTSVSSASTDTQYPSAKCLYGLCGDIESLINAL